MVEFKGEKYYTLQEFAALIQKSPRTVQLYIAKGVLKATVGQRPTLISESNAKDFLDGVSKE